MKEYVAPHIYNAAIADAKYVMERQFASIEDELAALERPLKIK